ncbi:hypothetical protein PAPHI01_2115 [Pancytospora philotis]|nr:hypothetical protein PAPHI01_2115 [Pancytospora philotis]
MQKALRDKTNRRAEAPMKSHAGLSDRETVISFLKEFSSRTRDGNLSYDLGKCVQLLEGKENQETLDLREALEEVLIERESLFREKCELVVELDMLKEQSSNIDIPEE